MSNVPKLRFKEFDGEWEEKKLGDTATFYNGRAYKQTELLSSAKYPVLRVGNFFTNDSWYYSDLELDENKYCENGDLLYAWSASFGPRIWEGNKVIYHYHIWKVVNHNQITKKFLFILLDNETAKMKAQTANGFALLHITKGTIENWKIKLPSKEEQEKIASFLTSVDTKIEQLTKKEALLQEYKKGVMSKIFNQEIRFKDEDGGEFPEWEEKRLGDIGEIVTGKTPSTTDIDLWNGDIRFITPTDIDDNVKYQSITQRTVVRQNKMKVLPIGSIVYTCIASIGKMQLTLHPSITNQQINSIIVNINHNNEFIYYSLLNMTPYIKSTQSNTTLPIINKTEFSKFIVGIPSLKEQTKIANFLSSIDKKIELTNKELNSTKEFKKALLQQMFV